MLRLSRLYLIFLLILTSIHIGWHRRSCILHICDPEICLIAFLLRHFIPKEAGAFRLTNFTAWGGDWCYRVFSWKLRCYLTNWEHRLMLVQRFCHVSRILSLENACSWNPFLLFRNFLALILIDRFEILILLILPQISWFNLSIQRAAWSLIRQISCLMMVAHISRSSSVDNRRHWHLILALDLLHFLTDFIWLLQMVFKLILPLSIERLVVLDLIAGYFQAHS